MVNAGLRLVRMDLHGRIELLFDNVQSLNQVALISSGERWGILDEIGWKRKLNNQAVGAHLVFGMRRGDFAV